MFIGPWYTGSDCEPKPLLSLKYNSTLLYAHLMFVLNPKGGGLGGPAGGEVGGTLSTNLWFFGQLGVYSLILRGAHVFFASREQKSLPASN